jgi:hypothetical protein
MGLDFKNTKLVFEKNGTKYYRATKDNKIYQKPKITAFTKNISVKNTIDAKK